MSSTMALKNFQHKVALSYGVRSKPEARKRSRVGKELDISFDKRLWKSTGCIGSMAQIVSESHQLQIVNNLRECTRQLGSHNEYLCLRC